MNKRLTLWSFLTFTLLLGLSFLKPSKAGAVSAWERTSLNKAGLTSIEVAPYGIFAGQKTTTLGKILTMVFSFQVDFGKTWREFGLQSYGITDIKVGTINLRGSLLLSGNTSWRALLFRGFWRNLGT